MAKKRKDKRYEKKVFIGYSESGKELYKSVYGKTIAERDQKASLIQASVHNGTYADDSGMTVRTWGEQWISTYKGNRGFSTKEGYRNILKNHLTPILDIRLKDLRKSDVQNCINRATGHYDIQRRIKLTLNQMLEAAIDDGLVYRNVCRGTTLPRKPKSNTRALTAHEKQIIPHCDLSLEEKCFVYLMWYAGLRPEEVRGLKKNNIDLIHRTIHIHSAVTFEQNQPVIGPPKTDAGYRTIDILSPLFSILSPYYASCNTLYLFEQKQGGLHTRTTYRRFWKHIYDKINIAMGGTKNIAATDITPYVFRHEYATMLYYSGIDVKEAARLMGHSDTRTIVEIYAELDQSRSNSTNKLETLISNGF